MLNIIGINEKLDCFLASQFQTIGGFTDKGKEVVAARYVHLQLCAVEHVSTLKQGGFPDLRPSVLAYEIEKWVHHSKFINGLQSKNLSSKAVADMLVQSCEKLENSKSPNTLVGTQ